MAYYSRDIPWVQLVSNTKAQDYESASNVKLKNLGGGIITLKGTSTMTTVWGIALARDIPENHKIYLSGFEARPINGGYSRPTRRYIYDSHGNLLSAGTWENPFIYTVPEGSGGCRVDLDFYVQTGETYNYFTRPFIIDLTATYGAGHEPDVSTCNSLFNLPWYAYNVRDDIE